jgi:hypothetical protein
MVRPLAHLAIPQAAAERPRLVIELWDAAESAVPSPLGSTSERPGEASALTCSADGRFLAFERPGSLLILDRAAQHLVGCVESSSRLPLVERARPLNLPLSVHWPVRAPASSS